MDVDLGTCSLTISKCISDKIRIQMVGWKTEQLLPRGWEWKGDGGRCQTYENSLYRSIVVVIIDKDIVNKRNIVYDCILLHLLILHRMLLANKKKKLVSVPYNTQRKVAEPLAAQARQSCLVSCGEGSIACAGRMDENESVKCSSVGSFENSGL